MTAAILITARLKSTRLPLKVIKPLKGRPMICHMIDRLKLAQRPKEIILCTSTVAQDDELEEIAARESISCYRGDAEDVLMRLTNAAQAFEVETVFSCTADNPFVDPEYIDSLLDYHLAQHYDYTRCEGLPLGAFGYAVSQAAMARACNLKAEANTEMWGPLFTETGRFSCGVFEVRDSGVRWPSLRLTVDTPEDFSLVEEIFDALYEPSKVFSLASIVDLCRRRPDLVAINSGVQQRRPIPLKLKSDLNTSA